MGGAGGRRPGVPRLPVLMTLVILAFVAGAISARLVWPATGTPASSLAVVTASPIPPTATLPATPTPTTPDIDGALPTLYIDIAPDDFARIAARREEALEQWILLASDADFVPATVRLGRGDPVPVRLRLKGDWADHFARDKWSYRVEVQGDHALLGMRVFSLQDPSTRTYLNEWLFLENLREEGVLAVGYRFVQVVQNGRAMGIYALEEGFSKELLESQGRREGVILRYDEDLLWRYWVAYLDDAVVPRGVMDFHLIDEFQSGKVRSDPLLSAQRTVAIGRWRAWEEGKLPTSQVFDLPTLAKFLALADVWGAKHALRWHNLRFYYNPITTRLEPIAFDTQALEGGAEVVSSELSGLQWALARGDSHLQRAYVQELWHFSQPDYLEKIQSRLGADFEALRAALMSEFGGQRTPAGAEVLAPPWAVLAQRQAALREMLSPIQTVYAYLPADAPTTTLQIDAGNLMDLPVEVVGVQVGEAWFPATRISSTLRASADALVLPPLPAQATVMPYARLYVPVALPQPTPPADLPTPSLVTRIWGLTQTVTQPVALSYPASLISGPMPAPPTLEAVLAQHPYLEVVDTEEPMLMIPPGTWEVSESLILPEGYGLRLEPGTTLRFAPQAFLLAHGGPLLFEGQEDAPIVLRPSEEVWRGVVVLGADIPSVWRHVVVENTDVITTPGWTLTGGITFYESPVRIQSSRLLGMRTEDGINVVRTRFEIVDTEFAAMASDALDADFCQGVIERSLFYDVGADGLDVSGSTVYVRDVQMHNVGDKGISVGEASSLTGEHLEIIGASFGVVSKDLSRVVLRDVTIAEVRVAGLAAYTKKPAYGPASIEAQGVTFVDVPAERRTLVQTHSWIDLEHTRIWGEDVDVEALYSQ